MTDEFSVDEQRVLVTMLKASPRPQTFEQMQASEDQPLPSWTDLRAALDALVAEGVLWFGPLAEWVDSETGQQDGYRLTEDGLATADRVYAGHDLRRSV